jgi:hypothetical protein
VLRIACLGATASSVHGLMPMPLASLTLRTPADSATTLPESHAQPALVAASVARLVQIRDEINGIRRWLQFSLFHADSSWTCLIT